jgi:hypothetical protein
VFLGGSGVSPVVECRSIACRAARTNGPDAGEGGPIAVCRQGTAASPVVQLSSDPGPGLASSSTRKPARTHPTGSPNSGSGHGVGLDKRTPGYASAGECRTESTIGAHTHTSLHTTMDVVCPLTSRFGPVPEVQPLLHTEVLSQRRTALLQGRPERGSGRPGRGRR